MRCCRYIWYPDSDFRALIHWIVSNGRSRALVRQQIGRADFDDPGAEARDSITAWVADSRLAKLAPPLDIDVTRPRWLAARTIS